MTGSMPLAEPGLAATVASRPPRILVIGYGNPGRGDDGLGPAAACAIAGLGWPNVSTLDSYQLAIEDAVDIAAQDLVWFVDATRSGEAPCAIERLSPAFDITFTTHLLKPEALLAIAAQQFGSSPDAFLLAIRGYEFEFIEGFSERAAANLASALALLRRSIGRHIETSQ